MDSAPIINLRVKSTVAVAYASHGGGGGGGSTPPSTPAVQVAPDAATMASGETQFVQVLVSSGSSTSTSMSVSLTSPALSVPAMVPVAAGGGFPQFQVTATSVAMEKSPVMAGCRSPLVAK